MPVFPSAAPCNSPQRVRSFSLSLPHVTNWQDAALAASLEVAASLANRQAVHERLPRPRLLPACKRLAVALLCARPHSRVHVLAVFADDGKTMYSGEFVHTPRSPFPAHFKTARCPPRRLPSFKISISHSRICCSLSLGILHFQAVAWSDFILKQAWCCPSPSVRYRALTFDAPPSGTWCSKRKRRPTSRCTESQRDTGLLSHSTTSGRTSSPQAPTHMRCLRRS